MTNSKYPVKYPHLKGSEQHHDLKNDPGKEGDPDHTESKDAKDKDDKKAE